MGRHGGRGKKWSRKRKAEEKDVKSDKPDKRNNNNKNNNKGGGGDGYNVIQNSNAKFEAYYSLVGLHNDRYNPTTKQFVPCTNDSEKHTERESFMSSLSSILPASFRIDRSLDATTQNQLLEELQVFVGKEMELEIELPTRSAAFGGMKNILDGTAAAAGSGVGEKKEEGKNGGTTLEESATTTTAKSAEDDNDKSKDAATASTTKSNPNYVVPTIVKRKIAPAKPIPFINTTNNDDDKSTVLGYQLSIDRRTLRRNKSLEPLHNWLKVQTDCGHITRQETVSMIPPVVLNVKEGMSVLDMCAAPGSKTCQLLEVVGGLPSSKSSSSSGKEGEEEVLEPKGYVVANDADAKRAYMLVAQLRRMNSPSVFVTSCDGQYFPILDSKSQKGTDREGMFDRVLCDVPCSGDGTVRKNPGIWKRWNQLGSLSLHPLQLSIALRGARLTHVGGYMVYSTCSMNPMENESVVAELLRIGQGSLILEDPRDRMGEGLIARPGWSTWKVLRESSNRTRRARKDYNKKNNKKMLEKRKEWEEKRARGECPPPKEKKVEAAAGDKDGEEEEEEKFVPSPYDTIPYIPPPTWDDAALRERTTSLGFVEYESYDDVEEDWKRRVRGSCFPPTEEEAERFELHKCLRCLPQDMDTGGFFVALLKKVKPLGKNATQRMEALARESRGGVEVDAHLKSGDKDDVGNGKKESEDVSMTDATTSAAEEKTDTEPEKKICKPVKEEGKDKDNEEPIQKAPKGKVGMHHKHQKKSSDLGTENFLPAKPSLWPPIIEEYGLAPTFPKDQFMVRASGEAKILYFMSKSIKEELIDRGIQDRVTVINSGLKGFERCSLKDTNVSYRIAQEGIQYVVPHITKRILSASMDDFHTCVKEGFIPFDKFSETFQKGLEELTPGSFIVTLKGYEKDISKKMFLVMWRRSNPVVNCFVAKIEMEGILSRMRALGYVAKEEVVVAVAAAADKEDKPAAEKASEETAQDKAS